MKQVLARSLLSQRGPGMVWYIIAGLCWAGTITSLPGYYLWFIELPIRSQFDTLHRIITFSIGLASLLCAILSLSLATLLFFRKSYDRTTLFVSYFLLFYGLIISGPMEMLEYFFLKQMQIVSIRLQSVFYSSLFIVLLLIFPNGVITPARFRWLIPPALLLSLIIVYLPLHDINSLTAIRSKLVYTYLAILVLMALGAQVYRYFKKSTLIERQQTKIVFYGTGLQFLFLTIASLYWFQRQALPQSALNRELPVSDLLYIISLSILPISLTFAIFRSHLWDIDVVIRRTLIYGFLTITLGLVYSISVIWSQQFMRLVAGHDSPIAIVFSTLAIAVLFSPLRRRIQDVIDRRFYRSKYNTEQALARFQQNLRGRVDLNQVEHELIGTVQSTVQPEWLMLWMRKPDNE